MTTLENKHLDDDGRESQAKQGLSVRLINPVDGLIVQARLV